MRVLRAEQPFESKASELAWKGLKPLFILGLETG